MLPNKHLTLLRYLFLNSEVKYAPGHLSIPYLDCLNKINITFTKLFLNVYRKKLILPEMVDPITQNFHVVFIRMLYNKNSLEKSCGVGRNQLVIYFYYTDNYISRDFILLLRLNLIVLKLPPPTLLMSLTPDSKTYVT